MKAAACALLLTGIIGAWEPPKIYLGLNSLYGTAADHRHIQDMAAAWEQPMGKGFSLIGRFHYLKVKQLEQDEEERSDNVYANVFPSTYRLLGFQSALRRHPWEWMPGFFWEALAGYKRIDGKNNTEATEWYGGEFTPSPGIETFVNHAFETGVGFGYLWEWNRLRCSLGFKFGPELLFRNSVYSGGGRESGAEVLDLLRFNALEAGFAF